MNNRFKKVENNEGIFLASNYIAQIKDFESNYNLHKIEKSVTVIRKLYYNGSMWDKVLIKKQSKINLKKSLTVNLDINDDQFLGGERFDLCWNMIRLVRLSQQNLLFDIAHVFAVLDALLNPDIVTPLPTFFNFLYIFFPHVKRNDNVAGNLGDLASYNFGVLINKLANKNFDKNKIMFDEAPSTDIVGNLLGYGIFYKMKKEFQFESISQLLENYFNTQELLPQAIQAYCSEVGLLHENKKIVNRQIWIKRNLKELRVTVAFYAFAKKRLDLAILVYLRFYDRKMNLKGTLNELLNYLEIKL